MKVREPVARPLDVVAVELLLSAAQAFLVGVLMYLAVGVWDDRGVGLGTVALVLGLLGMAVGGAWLFWLAGGVGWPMAAANTPVAMFLGFALVLGWYGEGLIRVGGVPLLLAESAALLGIVGGVFIDSPRRWRWDQREKLRPGTRVPRISPTTQALAAQVPRSLPRRKPAQSSSELAARIEASTPAPAASGEDVGTPHVREESSAAGAETGSEGAPPASGPEPLDDLLTAAPEIEGTEITVGEPAERMPMARLRRGTREPAASDKVEETADRGEGIELPTSVEPKAQRSPWAWAAPPEWNRDEDDESYAGGRSSERP